MSHQQKTKYQVKGDTSKPMKNKSNITPSSIPKAEKIITKIELQEQAINISATVKQSNTQDVEQHQTPPNSPISDYYIVEYSDVEAMENLCVGCGVNMGKDNPRQYCRKTHCPYEQ